MASTGPGACLGILLKEGASNCQPGYKLQQIQQIQPVRQFLGDWKSQPPAKKYSERRLVGYTPDQLYQVVADVQQYPQFVPWCQNARILTRKDDYLEAELEVGFQVFVERYTSKVTLKKPHLVQSRVTDSLLFDHLDSTWNMQPGPCSGTCWLTFKVDFAFKSALYRHIADIFFSEVVQRMMASFEGRCLSQYGPSAMTRTKGAVAKHRLPSSTDTSLSHTDKVLRRSERLKAT